MGLINKVNDVTIMKENCIIDMVNQMNFSTINLNKKKEVNTWRC